MLADPPTHPSFLAHTVCTHFAMQQVERLVCSGRSVAVGKGKAVQEFAQTVLGMAGVVWAEIF